MIRVLVADDSATARALLVGMFSSEPGFDVVGEAKNGQEAVEMAERLTPNLITMDVQMPVMDGLEATKQIMARSACPIIIISTTVGENDVTLSLEATRAGALMVLPKPEGPHSAGFASDRRQILSMARAMSEVMVVRRRRTAAGISSNTPAPRAAYATSAAHARSATLASAASAASAAKVRAQLPAGSIRLVAIGASTGGPAAIRSILSALPRSFPVPILIVQHIARGFTTGLAHWLNGDTKLHVKIAELGEEAVAGTVYIAPDDKHLGCTLTRGGHIRIVTDQSPAVGVFRPSASYLFRSAADALGPQALSVILTGMGDDGVAGLRMAKAAGGRVLAQDEASSVIYGMPREAALAGVVDSIVGLNAIARTLVDLTT